MAQAGADGISNGDSVAGPAMVSPEVYRKFALPFERKVVMKAHAYGLPYILHICGDTTRILVRDARVRCDWHRARLLADAGKARAAFKNNVVFSGNIDPNGVLAAGTRMTLERSTRSYPNSPEPQNSYSARAVRYRLRLHRKTSKPSFRKEGNFAAGILKLH